MWEDDLHDFGTARLLIAHARSAFRDEGICVENNMPFSDGHSVFVFNGELRGVRINSEGRIGAEKIYNYIRKLDRGNRLEALKKAVTIITKRTRYVRAMNIIMSDGTETQVSCNYSEDPAYFQLRQTVLGDRRIVCSMPYPQTGQWDTIADGTSFSL